MYYSNNIYIQYSIKKSMKNLSVSEKAENEKDIKEKGIEKTMSD